MVGVPQISLLASGRTGLEVDSPKPGLPRGNETLVGITKIKQMGSLTRPFTFSSLPWYLLDTVVISSSWKPDGHGPPPDFKRNHS